MDVRNDIFEKLIRLIPNLQNLKVGSSKKWEASAFMDLNLDVLEKAGQEMKVALSHYFLHKSGDMIADPDVEIVISLTDKTATGVAYQDAYGYQRAESPQNEDIADSINMFLTVWLNNILNTNYRETKRSEAR